MASHSAQSRLPLIDPTKAPKALAEAFNLLPIINLDRAMANADSLFPLYVGFIRSLLGPLELNPTLVRLIILFVAKESDCFYVWRHQVSDAKLNGVRQAQIDSLEICEIGAEHFSDKERIALHFAHEVIYLLDVTDTTFADTKRSFSDRAITEMLFVVGAYMFLCRIARTGRVPLDERFSLAVEPQT